MSSKFNKYTPTDKNQRPLAIINQDELQQLKDRKDELERKLNIIESKENKQQIPSATEKTINKTKKSEPTSPDQRTIQKQQKEDRRPMTQQKTKQNNQSISQYPSRQQPQQESSIANLRSQQNSEYEKQDLMDQIKRLEKARVTVESKYEKMIDALRTENLYLKEQQMKSNALKGAKNDQVKEIELDRNNCRNEIKKQKNEYSAIQKQAIEWEKKANESEAFTKQSKLIITDRDNRNEWLEQRLKEEEARHRETRQQNEQTKLDVKQLKMEIDENSREKERLSLDIEQISRKHNIRYEELHEVLLKERRDKNDILMSTQELAKTIKSKDERIRSLELERERTLVKLEEIQRMEDRLRLRDRQLIELELELERLHKEKGNVIVERIIREVPEINESKKPELIQHNADRPTEMTQLREQIIKQYQERDRLNEQVLYWKRRQYIINEYTNIQRFEDVEKAGDRAIQLMAHQNLDANENARLNQNKWKDNYDKLRSKAIGFVNNLQIASRKKEAFGIEKLLDQNKEFISLIAIKDFKLEQP